MYQGKSAEVFRTFLILGMTSFGGPVAHLAFFRNRLVLERRWLDEDQFAQVLALCQFLPGPASSQLGFAIGLMRAGWRGALAASVAFTLPSAALLFLFSALLPLLQGDIGLAAIAGLKLVAVAVVAHGVLGMSRRLCPDLQRAAIACVAFVAALESSAVWVQMLIVAAGAVAGLGLCRSVQPLSTRAMRFPLSRRAGALLLGLFAAILISLPLLPGGTYSQLFAAFYRAGALVFGGGHVVLPLLEEAMVGSSWIDADAFIAGYGAAQAVPGPMFSFAAYLGAEIAPNPALGAALGLIAIFLPGFLLVAAALPLWQQLASYQSAASVIAGVNAAVVGLLAAALVDPVFSSTVRSPMDFGIALVGFTLLLVCRASPLWVVLWSVLASVATTL